jgi:enolase-phosphatase E1
VTHIKARGLLLDIEGTTSSIDFIYREMFPFARDGLETYLTENWNAAEVQAARAQILQDRIVELGEAAGSMPDRADDIIAEVTRLMDGDVKTTGLKQLQGLIWRRGFESGELKSHLFDDVPPAFRHWHEQGLRIRIYSSGSIGAQKLFFGHTVAGNLLPFLEGHYDTTTGPKREAGSYAAIVKDWDLVPGEILFLSDVPAELDAACEAGMQTALSMRPGNAEIDANSQHPQIASFSELAITLLER